MLGLVLSKLTLKQLYMDGAYSTRLQRFTWQAVAHTYMLYVWVMHFLIKTLFSTSLFLENLSSVFKEYIYPNCTANSSTWANAVFLLLPFNFRDVMSSRCQWKMLYSAFCHSESRLRSYVVKGFYKSVTPSCLAVKHSRITHFITTA